MLVECPHCGMKFQVKIGRPRLNINCPKVLDNLDNLNKTKSVTKTAEELFCGKATIYRLLKQRGVSPKDITGRKYNKKEKIK